MNSSTSSAGPPSIRCRRKRNRTTNVNPGHGGGPLVCYSLGMDTEALRTAILDSLKEVPDPESPVNIVDLGLVYEVRVEDDGAVEVDMTLTSMGCPVQDMIQSDAEMAVMRVDGVSRATVEFVWSPPWGMDKVTDDGRRQLRMFGFSI